MGSQRMLYLPHMIWGLSLLGKQANFPPLKGQRHRHFVFPSPRPLVAEITLL